MDETKKSSGLFWPIMAEALSMAAFGALFTAAAMTIPIFAADTLSVAAFWPVAIGVAIGLVAVSASIGIKKYMNDMPVSAEVSDHLQKSNARAQEPQQALEQVNYRQMVEAERLALVSTDKGVGTRS